MARFEVQMHAGLHVGLNLQIVDNDLSRGGQFTWACYNEPACGSLILNRPGCY